MNRIALSLAACALALAVSAEAESFRAVVSARLGVSADRPEGATATLGLADAAVVYIDGDRRFIKGVELDIKVPQAYLGYRGTLGAAFYAPLPGLPTPGVGDFTLDRFGFDVLPAKLNVVYQLPLRKGHGLKSSPYATVVGSAAPPAFPLLFRLTPIVKGLPDELEKLRVQVTAKPLLSDDGALKVSWRYPEKLKDKPVAVLVDDAVVDDPGKDIVLGAGEHTVVFLSEHYRIETRRVVVERAKTAELSVDLQDPTPILSLEVPAGTLVYLDGVALKDPNLSRAVEPGEHELRFDVGEYSVTKPLSVQRGKTYRAALAIDAVVEESE